MNILYYGVFDGRKWRAEYPMAEGLEALGHTLFKSNFRSHLPWRIQSDWKKYRAQTDLIFIQNGIPFDPRHLETFDKPLVYMASEANLQSQQHLLEGARPPDFVIAHSQQTYDWCLAHHLPSQRLHNAFNSHFYKRFDVPFQYDLCFIGGLSPRRARILNLLKEKKYNLFVSQSWRPEQVNLIYNQSRLSLHIHAIDETYLPTRLFEVMPTQSCFLVEDMGKNYDPVVGEGFESWSNEADLLEKIDFLLATPNAREEKVNLANAMAPLHNWKARMREFGVIFQQVLERSQA